MSIEIKFTVDTVEEAIVLLGRHVDDQAAAVVTTSSPGPASTAATEATNTVAKLGPAKSAQILIDEHNLDVSEITGTGKDGRITKGDVEKYIKSLPVEEEPEDLSNEPGENAEGETEATIELARDKLKELNGAKDMDTCLQVLSRFGVKRISELKKEQYQGFIEKCDAVIKGEAV